MAVNQEVEICFVVLMGLPGSGKTTLCKMLCDFLKSPDNFPVNSHHIIPICYDSLIPVDTIKYKDESNCWKEARKNILRNVALLIRHLRGFDSFCMTNMFDSALSELKSNSEWCKIFVLIDDNMFYRSMRYEYYQLARLYNTSFCQLYVQCDVNDALKQNSSREPAVAVPEEVIFRMVENLEPPSNCNFWERASLILNTEKWTNSKIEEICQFLINASKSPEFARKDDTEMRAESRAVCSANIMHQVDVVLRRLVGERMKEHKQKNLVTKNLKVQSKLLADVRQLILEAVKTGTILLPQEIQESIKQQLPDSRSKLQDFLNYFFILHQL